MFNLVHAVEEDILMVVFNEHSIIDILNCLLSCLPSISFRKTLLRLKITVGNFKGPELSLAELSLGIICIFCG